MQRWSVSTRSNLGRSSNAVSSEHTPVVSTTAELLVALAVENPATNILLAPGTYVLTSTLTVPDGTTLVGSGSMQIDNSTRLPTGMAVASRSTIVGTPGLVGNVVVLGNHSGLSRLMIEDVSGHVSGSVVAVKSRSAGDVVKQRSKTAKSLRRMSAPEYLPVQREEVSRFTRTTVTPASPHQPMLALR